MSSKASSWPAENCRFAIPKKGRLFEKVVEMLKGAGIEFRREPRLDVALCKDLPITLVFLPAADIAKYVGEGNVDIGITGLDVVKESFVEVDHVLNLGFGKCKLCVQAPVASKIEDVSMLAGGRIVTSFPDLTKEFFKKFDEEKGVTTSVKFVSGSVEAACGLGLADAVVDLVETGTTMRVSDFLRLTSQRIELADINLFGLLCRRLVWRLLPTCSQQKQCSSRILSRSTRRSFPC